MGHLQRTSECRAGSVRRHRSGWHQLDLKGAPPAIRQFRWHQFPALGSPGSDKASLQKIRRKSSNPVHTKPQTGSPRFPDPPAGWLVWLSAGRRQGTDHRVPLDCLFDPHRRTDTGGEGRLVIGDEEHFKISRYSLTVSTSISSSSTSRMSFFKVLLVAVVLSFLARERRSSRILLVFRLIPSIR